MKLICTKNKHNRFTLLYTVASLFFLVSCGGDDEPSAPPLNSTDTETPDSSETPSEESSGEGSADENAEDDSTEGEETTEQVNEDEEQCTTADVLKLFEAKSCNNCHGATVFAVAGGGLDLTSEQLDSYSLNKNTANEAPNCNTGQLINSEEPDQSLFLQLTDPEAYQALNATDCKRPSMPQSGAILSKEESDCVKSWIEATIKNQTPPPTENVPVTFAPSNAGAAMIKAKYILHGGAVTADELTQLGDDKAALDAQALKSIIATWEESPEYEDKIKQFLQLTLQQDLPNEFASEAYRFQLGKLGRSGLVLEQGPDALKEAFVRTAFELVKNEGDFREVVTTRKWQVNSFILTAMSYADEMRRNFNNTRFDIGDYEHFVGSDFTDWRTVEIVQSTTPAAFTDGPETVARMRAIPEGGAINLRFPRVGFFSSPAFLGKWRSNVDNQFRVTAQQTMITALDRVISPADATNILSQDGIPLEHADPQSACYQCHKRMDPMRLVFQNFQTFEHRSKPADSTLQPTFSFFGVSKNVTTVDEFANEIVQHALFPQAWVQKLCMWGNSTRCEASDPEFLRLAEMFKSSDFNFKLLLREFFSSPIFTGSAKTASHDKNGFIVSLSRGQHFCHALSSRIENLKSVNGTTGNVNVCNSENYLGVIGPDVNARGDTHLVQIQSPGMFESKSFDLRCAEISNSIFSVNDDTQIINVSKGVDIALSQLVEHIIGIPQGHSSYDETFTRLKEIYAISSNPVPCAEGQKPEEQTDEVLCGFGNTPTDALRAAWFSACTAPHLTGIGM